MNCPVSLASVERRVLRELPPDIRLRVTDGGAVLLGPRAPLEDPATASAFALGRRLAIEATFGEQTSPPCPSSSPGSARCSRCCS